jgi:predicted nucleotidyltransferase
MEPTRGWIDRDARRMAAIAALRARLEARIPDLCEVLRSHGVQEALIFGSFATERLRPDSDLDLAVRGADPASWYRLGAALERAAGMELDLLDLDRAPPELAQRILAHGRRILP